jgi:hypothetical protein
MSNFYYEIEADGSVIIFDGVNPEPFVRQPTWANGTEWSGDEASKWAEQVILSIEDPTAAFAGNSPEEPTIERPIVVEEVPEEPEDLPE